MADHPLDNPIWHALQTRHRAMAMGQGGVLRYPARMAPFAAVAGSQVDADPGLQALVEPGETVYLLGPQPVLPSRWSLRGPVPLAQMVCDAPVAAVDGAEVIALDASHRQDVLALTALVYPHYFRPRTMEMGRYVGIYLQGRLAAMAGERLGMDAWQEVSAVCTHPDFTGHGHARRLLAWLGNDILARGRTPFLHVSLDNQRALDLYRRNGYRTRIEIDYWSLQRRA